MRFSFYVLSTLSLLAQEPVVGGGKIVDCMAHPGGINATYVFDLRGIRYTNDTVKVATNEASICFHGEYEPYSESKIKLPIFNYSNVTFASWAINTNTADWYRRWWGGVRDGASGQYLALVWYNTYAQINNGSVAASMHSVSTVPGSWNRRLYSIRKYNASNIVTWGAGSGSWGGKQSNFPYQIRSTDPWYIGSMSDQNIWFDGRMTTISIYNYAITNDCFDVGSAWRSHSTPPHPPQGNVYQ